jgi:ubiquinol-cytochrome c reductase cytochrome b subunit
LLALIPPQLEGYVMILGPALICVLLLAAPLLNNRGERAPSRRPWSIAVVLLSVIMIGSLWIAGANSPWSPNFDPQPLPEKVVGATSGPMYTGAKLFRDKGRLNCRLIDGYGGRRGPDLTYVGDRLAESDIVIRIVNDGVNVPAFGNHSRQRISHRSPHFFDRASIPSPQRCKLIEGGELVVESWALKPEGDHVAACYRHSHA